MNLNYYQRERGRGKRKDGGGWGGRGARGAEYEKRKGAGRGREEVRDNEQKKMFQGEREPASGRASTGGVTHKKLRVSSGRDGVGGAQPETAE